MKKKLEWYLPLSIIFIGILVIIFILVYFGLPQLGEKKKKALTSLRSDEEDDDESLLLDEGFDVFDQIKDLSSEIKKTGKVFDEVPGWFNKMGGQLDQLGDVIEHSIVDRLGGAISSFGDVIYEGIIAPIGEVFEALGNVFVQFGNIMETIGNKIGSLNRCMKEYFFASMASVMPDFLVYMFEMFDQYIIEPFFSLFGSKFYDPKCLHFDISGPMKSVNNGFKEASENFRKKFGQMDFSKIKI